MQYQINGIQQIGIGIPSIYEAWQWYIDNLGYDVKVFEEAADAGLMTIYTGGKVQSRHAALAMNMQGGGGFEIWQYTSRIPKEADFEIQLGDLGFYAAKIRSYNIQKSFQIHQKNQFTISPILKNNANQSFYFVKDTFNNLFQIVENQYCFKKENKPTGGLMGCVIGVSNIEKSIQFYSKLLGYDTIISKTENKQLSFYENLKGGTETFDSVILSHSKPKTGAFSNLLGPTQLELIAVKSRTPKKIFENRYWGDRGFIHLCFDVNNMQVLKSAFEKAGHPFTVDSSNTFDMGEAAGHFSYVEDPDGNWIEFVETHKVPIIKKLGWYIDLKKRNNSKPLPNFIVKAMGLNRVKNLFPKR